MTVLTGGMIPRKRRVFFSFHYQNDIMRVNQVRNSWRFQNEATREAYGFYDGSLWERSKRHGDEALKQLIRQGMDNTSVTCVLAGTNTYQRRWVRYEIAQSMVKGNGLLTVQIHNLRNPKMGMSPAGPNSLDYIGLYRTNDGRLLLAEMNPLGQWVQYSDYVRAINLPAGWEVPASNAPICLSRYFRICDYSENGRDSFGGWIRDAAALVSR